MIWTDYFGPGGGKYRSPNFQINVLLHSALTSNTFSLQTRSISSQITCKHEVQN